MPNTHPNPNPSTPRTPPPEGPGGVRPDDLVRMTGNLQDDRSRRRRNRPQEEEDDLQIDCLVKSRDGTTFDDIGGNEEAKAELMEIAEAIKHPESYIRFGAHLPKGILMTGKPGTGKTYMTSALANALDAPFYHVQVSNVVSMWFGQSERNLQKIFDHAKMYCHGEIEISHDGTVTRFNPDEWAAAREAELLGDNETPPEEGHQNRGLLNRFRRGANVRETIRQELTDREATLGDRYAIIFFDEIDALGAARENTPFQGGVSNRIVSVLLENMDGLESNEKIVVVASTNRIYAVDSALRRAGRFDRVLKIKKPDRSTRAKIFDIHFKKAEKAAGREFSRVNSTEIAMETEGLVGADISEIVRKTCQEQAKKWRDAPTEQKEHFDFITTEMALETIKSYRSNLRDKNSDSKKGAIGFRTQKEAVAEKKGEIVEDDLDGKPDTPDQDEPGAEVEEQEL